MSNKNVKELVKNVIEENAVAFKTTLNRTLYSKVGQKLQEKYVQLSQNIFEVANPPGGLNNPDFENENPIVIPTMGNPNKPLADPREIFKGHKNGDKWKGSDGTEYKMEGGIIYFWHIFKDGSGGWLPLHDDHIYR
jgi:hypothetical protein